MESDNDRTVVRTGHRTSRAPGDDMSAMSGAMNTLPIGTRLGEFEIKDLIGEGGFGIVYLAYDHSLDRHVALKEYMPSGMAARTQMRQVTVRSRQYEDTFVTGLKSFINEARLLARFDSPSLVKVYRFWEENGTAYMAMPFYDGVTLKQAYKEKRISPDEEWIRALLANMFDALETIHREQCFHRDVAPDNILLLKDGRPLLLDFGAARRVIGDLTQGPTVILKPGFAPIEQYADIPGLRQGAWTDIYALGAVVYYLITGKAPSPAVSRVVHDDMLPARAAGRGRFSDAFLAAIDHALAVKPEHRIQSVPAMRLALDMEGVEARPLPGAAGAARAGTPKAGAAPKPGAAGMTGLAGRNVDQGVRQETRQAARGMPPSTMPKNAADADDDATEVDWKKSMVGEQRYYPQERSRRKAGLVAAVLLAAGAGSALIAYQLMMPGQEQDVLAQAEDTRRSSAGAQPTASTGTPDTAGGMNSGSGSGTVQGTARVPAPRPAPAAATPPMAPVAPAPPAPPTASDATRTRDIIPPPIQAERSSAGKDKEATRELPPQAKATAPAAPATEAAEERLWNGAKNTDTAEGYKAYLKRYPEGKYAAVARILAQEKQHSELAMLGEPSERQAKGDAAVSRSSTGSSGIGGTSGISGTSGTSRSGNGRDTAKTADSAPGERNQAAGAPASSQRAKQAEQPPQKADTSAGTPAASPPETIAKNTAPAAQAEQARREAPFPAEPKEENSLPAAAGPQRTYTFPGQTMVGNFSADPVSGLVSGSGQIRWDNGDRFEGRLVKGIKEGKGRFVWANGQEYIGDWSADKPNGRGVLKFANGNRYDGEVRDGQPHGQGTTRFQSGDVYSGNWVRGVLNGRGVLQFATGDRYEGELRNGEPDGQGKTRFRSGDVYVGQWARGKHHGQGRYTWQSGNYWEGEFRDGSQTSNGQLVRAESGANTVPATASGSEGAREGPEAEGAGR